MNQLVSRFDLRSDVNELTPSGERFLAWLEERLSTAEGRTLLLEQATNSLKAGFTVRSYGVRDQRTRELMRCWIAMIRLVREREASA